MKVNVQDINYGFILLKYVDYEDVKLCGCLLQVYGKLLKTSLVVFLGGLCNRYSLESFPQLCS